jgi:hypothetical protein
MRIPSGGRRNFRRLFVRSLAPVLLLPTVLSVLLVQSPPAGANSGFTPGDVVIYRVGTGGTLSSASAAVSLAEYSPTGTLVQSVALPTSSSGSSNALTAGGSASSEGLLSLSADSRYLLATGYDTSVGTANVTSTPAATVPRTVARVDASDNVDTSTALTNFADGNNPRSVVSTDGTQIWLGGAAGGVEYTTLGATTATSLNSSDKNVRQVSIFDNQLYTSADPTKQSLTIATVGSGLPTTPTQTISNLSFSQSPSEPYAYVMMTLGSGPGPDTMYVADNATNSLERYDLVGATWTASGTTTIANVTGVTGVDNGGTVTLYATESGSNGTSGKLFKVVDNSGVGGTLTAGATTLVSAPSGEAFRGVAFAPGTNLGPGGGNGGTAPTIVAAHSGLPAALGDPTNTTMDITVGDANFSPTALTVTATSSNQSVAPNSGITVTGTGADRTLTVTPGVEGTSTLTLAVTAPDSSEASTTVSYGVTAAAPDPSTARYYSGAGNASTAIDVGGGYMLVGDDESDILRLYQEGVSGPPVKTFDFTSELPFGATEMDIEASARSGNRIYWEGSMSNDSSGNLAPARGDLFATDITGSGTSTNLTYVGSYTGLRQDLINWDNNDEGGQFGFATSSASGVPPHEPDAFNAEGLEFAPGSSTTAYLGFRAPLEPPGTRNLALIVPITNINDLVDNGNPGTVTATFGDPIQMDLGGQGIREIRKNAGNQYLIIAGSSDETPGQNLYLWDGVPTDPPRESLTSLSLGADRGNWESVVDVPDPLAAPATFQLLQDNGDTDWYGDSITSKNGLNVDLQKDLGDTFTYEPPAPLPTTTNVSSSKNPSNAGDLVTFTATVAPSGTTPAGARPPQGTVEFTDGGVDISGCSAVVLDGSDNAKCSTTYPVSGTHDIVATYSGGVVGDDTYAGSVSPQLTQGVGVAPSTTVLSSTANPVGRKQSLTYIATVTGTGPPTGTVEFSDGGVDIPGCSSVALDGSAVATCTTSYTKVTTKKVPAHQIEAVYSGDDANSGSSGSLTQTISKKPHPYTTATSLGSSAPSTLAGHSVTLTATVSTASGTATGKVRFLNGTKTIQGCGRVNTHGTGTATCTATFASAGTPSLSAVFLGDKFDKPSTSSPVTVTVNAAPTDTTVTSSLNPAGFNQTVEFTATVTSPDGGTPTGSVTFSIGGTAISGCSARPLSSSATATCKTHFSTFGDQTIDADYSGSGAFQPSTGTFDQSVS